MDKKEFAIEQANLDETIEKIKNQTYYVTDLIKRKSNLMKQGESLLGDDISYLKGIKDKEILEEAIEEPFFGRVDYVEEGERETIYIGKKGINNKNEEQIVVDWRRPVTSIFYNFTSGKPRQSFKIKFKDGREQKNFVEVVRKRDIKIENGKITRITQQLANTDSKNNATFTNKGETLEVTDDFLREILENSETTGYLKEIIATIQKEQNEAIRQPIEKNVVIQGVAGSGKSSIALHRLSYLLFNNDHIQPDNVLILGPTKLFIQSFKDLLPELDLSGIQQATVQDQFLKYLNPYVRNINSPQKYYFENILFKNQITSDLEKKQIEYKGSEDYALFLDLYIDQLISQFPQKFKNISILQEYLEIQDQQKIYDGYAYLPFMKRVEKFIQHIENHFKSKLDEKKNEEKAKLDSIRGFLRNDGLSLEERNHLLKQLEKVLKNKTNRMEVEFKEKITAWKKRTEVADLLTLYKQSLNGNVLNSFKEELGNADVVPEIFSNYKLTDITYFDLAPLLYLYIILEEVPEKFSHIIIDEAQDLSYMHFAVIKKLTKTMTILGDIDQGIYMDYGQNDWYKLVSSFFNNDDDMLLKLKTSYRSTKEIVEAANIVLSNQFGEKHEPITPLNRKGAELVYHKVDSGGQLLEDIVQTVEDWKQKYKRVAIIHKDEQRAIKLAKYLKNEFKSDVVYLNPHEEAAQQPISILTSYHSKGMEFDAVILVNINKESFPQDSLHAKLLYVMLTRAQQEVKVYYQDQPSPLLDGLIQKELAPTISRFDDIL
ncbi:UvrD-helicase domain-containing protein [Fictibacillus sp. WQ 8-8]|uniref:HelD family protein n=1 Tax=Fictibacillus sp. WQ 8-8 TaxID=2938788 RepID=UPI00210A72E2|nr:3'-5' exonuclease [Fictibacillus sp. WQ 8-8]MCQ6264546.1 UvrD-helicase domain-containing protein [Fictibacillus sp. WQ 8-8]